MNRAGPPVCCITGTPCVTGGRCSIVRGVVVRASGGIMSFALVSDFGAVAIPPVGDIRDDLCPSVRQLDTILPLDRVPVTGLMSIIVIT